jgi:hypothetical protein
MPNFRAGFMNLMVAMTVCVFASQVKAEQINYAAADQKPWYSVSEFRFGGGVTDPTQEKELSGDMTAEVLFQPVGNDSWWDELRFRPTIGANGNLGGRTSFGYLSGTFDVLNWEGLFADADLGMSVHNGQLHVYPPDDPSRRALGSRAEFRESAEFGYQFTPRYAISTYIDHQSNAGLLSKTNAGLETVGARFSWMIQ